MIEQTFSSPTCFEAASVIGPEKIFFVIFSVAIASFLLLLVSRTSATRPKITFAYLHLLFLFLPFFMLTTNAACGLFCMNCHNNLPALMTYVIPASAFAAGATGFVALPTFFMWRSRKQRLANVRLSRFTQAQARRMRMRSPRLYTVDRAQPFAFSFRNYRSAIFFSIGLLELLTPKEREAVVLHELYHIKTHASTLKFSGKLLHLFSPLSLIVRFYDQGNEEAAADAFAMRTQGSSRHIRSAQRKIEEFQRTAAQQFFFA